MTATTTQVYLVILIHEHGVDISAHSHPAAQHKAAMEMMQSTLDELADEIDDDEDGLANLDELKKLLAVERPTEGDAQQAKELYESLYEEFAEDMHELVLKHTELDESRPGFCKRCGSELSSHGHCPDMTCPYHDRHQDEPFTEE